MSGMVELNGVSKVFGSFTALQQVSFDILEGEFMTFLGPSGCGKTTCLRLISGFDTPTTGTVKIAGQDVTHLPPYHRDVNQVFQSYALFPHLSIYDNVAFGLRMKRLPDAQVRERVDRVVEMTGLVEMTSRRPSQLSGGQRQRVALARAIVCEPKVLLLDEPLSALDAKLRQQMRSELKSLQKRLGITFIFVTHDQEEALTMSDRIAVLSKGRIEQIGTVAEIYYHPATRFVAEFIGDVNLLSAQVTAHADGRVLCQLENGCTLISATGSANHRWVAFRPEKVEIHAQNPGGDNVLEVKVQSEIFKGALEEVSLQAANGLAFRAIRTTTSGLNPLGEGVTAFARIAPEDVTTLE